MLTVVQRVDQSSVKVDGEIIGEIKKGLNVLVGVCQGDQKVDAEALAEKIVHLRCFEDDQQKMNLSIMDKGGQILTIPQFTLCADCFRGRRPSFTKAAPPDRAQKLYQYFNECLRNHELVVKSGSFGAYMQVGIANNGPVTFVLDSKKIL